MATVATRKTATPRKRAAKVVSVPQTTETASVGTPVDPDTYVPPTGLQDGFKGNGSVPLDRLTDRARENMTELAMEGNTNQARRYWTRQLSRYGIHVTPSLVPEVTETD